MDEEEDDKDGGELDGTSFWFDAFNFKVRSNTASLSWVDTRKDSSGVETRDPMSKPRKNC